MEAEVWVGLGHGVEEGILREMGENVRGEMNSKNEVSVLRKPIFSTQRVSSRQEAKSDKSSAPGHPEEMLTLS